jgi:hypothetical protein
MVLIKKVSYIIRDFDHKVKTVRDVKILQRLHTPVESVVPCTVVLEGAEKLSDESRK